MPTPTIFNAFKADVTNGIHDLDTHTLKVALTNTAPVATNSVLADITQIAAGNGYTTGGATATVTSSSQTGGAYSLVLAAVAFTASGGSMATFRYVVLYNDTSASDSLICWYDVGAAVTLTVGQVYQANAGTWLSA